MNAEVQLSQGLAGLRLTLSSEAQTRLLQYLVLLSKWNRTYNLTAIREPSRLVSHHLLDSLAVLPYIEGNSIVDVGSGAGLPGIPLAIARPEWNVVLVDSNHKKCAFLRQAAVELKLQGTQIVTVRAEQWHPVHRFDVVISRAFSDLPGFVETARHLCGPGAVMAAMKGVHPDEELAQLGPDIRVHKVLALHVPGLRAARHLVLLEPLRAAEA
jgi:16S rRNA (guanine527-N7)-methyltransferase